MLQRFRQLMGVTTGLTFVLVLLGLYTGATAGGLSCGTRWPLCNGFLGLFPADWASFFEWFHRFVAMIVGFLLLGALYSAWRWQDDRRIRLAVTVAIAILPLQIVLGGVTTTAGGLFPNGFNPVIMAAHFTTAVAIFALLVAATVLAFDRPGDALVRRIAGASVALVGVHALFEFVAVASYPPANQMGFYAGSFALLAALIALVLWSRAGVGRPAAEWVQPLAAGAAAVLVVDMILSRKLFGVPAAVGSLTTVLLAALVAVLAWRLLNPSARFATVESQGAD